MSRESRKAREAFYARPWTGPNRHYAMATRVVDLLSPR